MSGRGAWGVAGLASVAVHAVLAAGLALAVAPAPPPKQAPGEARLDLAAYRVPESQAGPAELPDEAAPEAKADRASVGGAAIPVSRARPSAPQGSPSPHSPR